MSNGGVPRELRSELMYAAAAANAWLRGLPLPTVALNYRYEPVTALQLIRRCCRQYGRVNVEPFVPPHTLACATRHDAPRDRGEAGSRGARRRMIEDMAQVHISEAELARDLHAVLEKVRQGAEVVVERNHQPLAVLRAATPRRRTISECIALAEQREKERGYAVTLDPEFAAEVEHIVDNRKPWNPASWD